MNCSSPKGVNMSGLGHMRCAVTKTAVPRLANVIPVGCCSQPGLDAPLTRLWGVVVAAELIRIFS
jgi:hypothetical protein